MKTLPFVLVLAFATLLAAVEAATAPVHLGIDVLQQAGFRILEGRRVGLLTHPAGVNRNGRSTVDVLRKAPNVRLTALFGPEHGIYGNEKASVPVDDRIDSRTGLPVFSLYGKYRRPTPEMLRHIDTLVIDLQDIGVRSYTYVSCMRYAMEACFEAGVEVVVLDRPNPLGGLKADGPMLDRRWRSYVGAFHVPYVHGLTIGELARIAKSNSGWLEIPDEVRQRGVLRVIPMRGWSRSMLWPATGLRWIATSPNIPDLSAVLGYAMTGLGAQEGGFSHGIGTPYPFRLLRFDRRSASSVRRALLSRNMPGLDFRVIQTRTKAGAPVEGVYVMVRDWEELRPTELSFHMMQLSAAWSDTNPFASPRNADLFNKHTGSSAWWNEIQTRGASARVDLFVDAWTRQAKEFHRRTRAFWLYR